MSAVRTRALVATALLSLILLAALAIRGARPAIVLGVYVAASALHAFVAAARLAPRGAIPFAAASLALLVLAPPVFSADVHRYAWDGRLLSHGISPYAAPPSDPSLAHLRDASWQHINHRRIATIYPPLAQVGFAIVSPLGIRGPKLLAALAVLGLVALVRAEERRGRAPVGATFTLASFPPLLVECGLEGHVDGLATLALVAGLLALRYGHAARAAAWAACAVLTKLVGVLLVPALLRRHRLAALAVLVALPLAVLPLAHSGGSSQTAGLAHYARRWSGGSPGYALVEAVTSGALLACCRVDGRRVALPLAERLLPLVSGTPLDPRVDLGSRHKEPPRVATLHVSVVAPFFARGLVALGLSLLALRLALREDDPLVSVRTLALAALFFVPRLLPWYGLVLAPLDALAGRRAGLLFATVALLGHVPVDRWTSERVWQEPTALAAIGSVLVLSALVRERRALRA